MLPQSTSATTPKVVIGLDTEEVPTTIFTRLNTRNIYLLTVDVIYTETAASGALYEHGMANTVYIVLRSYHMSKIHVPPVQASD